MARYKRDIDAAEFQNLVANMKRKFKLNTESLLLQLWLTQESETKITLEVFNRAFSVLDEFDRSLICLSLSTHLTNIDSSLQQHCEAVKGEYPIL